MSHTVERTWGRLPEGSEAASTEKGDGWMEGVEMKTPGLSGPLFLGGCFSSFCSFLACLRCSPSRSPFPLARLPFPLLAQRDFISLPAQFSASPPAVKGDLTSLTWSQSVGKCGPLQASAAQTCQPSTLQQPCRSTLCTHTECGYMAPLPPCSQPVCHALLLKLDQTQNFFPSRASLEVSSRGALS